MTAAQLSEAESEDPTCCMSEIDPVCKLSLRRWQISSQGTTQAIYIQDSFQTCTLEPPTEAARMIREVFVNSHNTAPGTSALETLPDLTSRRPHSNILTSPSFITEEIESLITLAFDLLS